jgi:rhodanese-related sulfurtransferase
VAKYKSISRNELREKLADREENFTLIEVLPKAAYDHAHLPQAINIPVDDLQRMVPRLIPNLYEDIAVYGAGPDCDASHRAAEIVVGMDYKSVKVYAEGKSDWVNAGLPIESNHQHEAA